LKYLLFKAIKTLCSIGGRVLVKGDDDLLTDTVHS